MAGATREKFAFTSHVLAPGLTIHVYPFSKRKTNQLSVYWVGDLDNDVTRRALLPSVLLRGNERYPTLRDMTRRLETLYGTTLTSDVRKVGERHGVLFQLECVNDRYVPGGESVLRPVIEFLRDTLEHPHLTGTEFPAAVIDQERENHRRMIEGLLNHKGAYARERCVEEMCRDELFRLYEYGSVADLPGITPAALARTWRTELASAVTHIYFAGDLDLNAATRALEPLAAARTRAQAAPRSLRPLPTLRRAAPGGVRRIEEEMEVQQAKLVLGFRTGTRFGDPLTEAVTLANGVLGQFPHSKLFVNVREKASLCYAVGSSLDRAQGLLLISAGIDPGKREQAEALILEQVRDVAEGRFTDEELESTKRSFDNRLAMNEDNPRALMDVDFAWRVSECDYDHEAYRAALARTGRDAVQAAAARFELDTAYFLHPGKEK